MVDVVLMNQLLRAVPTPRGRAAGGGCRSAALGRPRRGAGRSDRLGAVPTVRLTEIFRQAAASRIVVNAHRINAGQLPEDPAPERPDSDFYLIRGDTPEAIHERLIRVVTERIPQRFGLDPVRDIQVLTPMNRGGLGARALNVALQAALNPDAQPRIERFGSTYAPGDKVIQLVNDYDKEVFNGDIGRIQQPSISKQGC